MASSEAITRLLNPLVLHLKKMELELNCPTCLGLLNQPMLLPCDHILCSCCSGTARNNGYSCPVCMLPYERKDLRTATHIERFLTIYKNLSSTISTLQQSSSFVISGSEVPSSRSPISCNNIHVGKKRTHIAGDETSVERGHLTPPIDNLRDSDSDSWNEEAKLVAKRKSADVLGEDPNCYTKCASLNDCKESNKDRLKNSLTSGLSKDGSNIETCAFCHSFRTTEASGEMLHYLDGKPLSGDQASKPGVLHVHRKCIEWAPQVYFSGETVMNLEVELLRSSKLKCCSCGLKGAALGCYAKSCRRSFHVPCAYEILECRWDIENYLVLCPAHASNKKLPCDKSKSKKSKDSIKPPVPLVNDMKKLSHAAWASSCNLHVDWLICGSDLSKEEKEILDTFSSLSGCPVTYQWKQNVTHVIAGINEHGACMRTMKYLMAILCGRWVLNMGWIKACLEAKNLVPEDTYEITHDAHGCFGGPKSGRIRAMQKILPLFNRLAFHFSGFSEPAYLSNLERLAVAAGGRIAGKSELHNLSIHSSAPREIERAFVICCVEPPKDGVPTDIDEVVQERLCIAKTLAAKTGSAFVPHTLFLNAIAAHDLHMLPER